MPVARRSADPKASGSPALEDLLEYLKDNRGFDFTAYKRASLERRISKRMAELHIEDISDYRDYLEVTPGEFTELFNTILINVTGFFRDPEAWDHVADEIVPKLAASKDAEQPIRVWSAACSSGEEAYTAAIVLAEQLGEEAFKRRVKIYATDIDEGALARARQAVFQRQAMKGLPAEYLDRYFERTSGGYLFRPDLRRYVIFGRNDLVQDAPISNIDLLISRNALMYFTREAQTRILSHFNFALHSTGFLFLGKSEMLTTHADLFSAVDLKWRVFKKVPAQGIRNRLPEIADALGLPELQQAGIADLHARALEVVPTAQVVVDRNGYVVSANDRARRLFAIGAGDLGRPFQDLELSYRPLDLRSALEIAYGQGKVVALGRIDWNPSSAEPVTLEASVTPVLDAARRILGASITFEDVTEFALLDALHQQSQQDLEKAYEELQSTVEELETTNEELQSTNEELETTNEELQSTNEELETMNEDQRLRAREMDRVNIFLEAILGNLGVGVIVLDSDQRIQMWNAASHELWGVASDEVEGEHLMSLDIGLPVDQLRAQLREALEDSSQPTDTTLEAVNRRGRTFNCFVRTLPMIAADGTNHGVIMLVGNADQDASIPAI